MTRRPDEPVSGNGAHFSGSTSRRRSRVRAATAGGHLRLVRPGEQEPALTAPAPYHPPVRAGVPARPEWLIGLPPTLVDLPDPLTPPDHLECSIDLLRRAAQSLSVSERGDAIIVGVEHAARSFAELFDRETAKKLLRDIADGL
ncbi:MAG: hypothetical protein U0324_22405 [Polyangiales bacterium]